MMLLPSLTAAERQTVETPRPTSATVIEAVSDSDNDDVDAVLDSILCGKSNIPIPIYNEIHRPLSAHLPISRSVRKPPEQSVP